MITAITNKNIVAIRQSVIIVLKCILGQHVNFWILQTLMVDLVDLVRPRKVSTAFPLTSWEKDDSGHGWVQKRVLGDGHR